MDTKQINDVLERYFHEEGARVVFWNDPDKEFQSILPSVQLSNVTVIRLDEHGALRTKIRIEREEPNNKFLLYASTEEPDYENDWLLDVRLFSRSFRADRASILLEQLGLSQQHLRNHLAERRKFFDNKDRLAKLKPMIDRNDVAVDLDRKMLGVLTKSEQPEFFNIVRALYHGYVDSEGSLSLDNAVAAWEQIEKFDLANAFWTMAETYFGYKEETPSLKALLIRLMVTDLAYGLRGNVPKALSNLVLPGVTRSNVITCLSQWRDSGSRCASYDRLAGEVSSILHLADHLSLIEFSELAEAMTFLDVEKATVLGLRDRIQANASMIDAAEIRAVAIRRQSGHWASLTVSGAVEVPRRALYNVYDALVSAAQFLQLKNECSSGFSESDPLAFYQLYESKLFRFDQLYRYFCESADIAESEGWNVLKPLRESIEEAYTNWYLPTLGVGWGKVISRDNEDFLLNSWKLGLIPNQYRFYEEHVQRRLDESESRKTFVIISDAFRYEAAEELTSILNGKYRLEATLSSQLGVIPSYTALGMASLLPHKVLSYKANGDVLIDGLPTSSTQYRDNILAKHEGLAVQATDLTAMKKEDGRELVAGKRVVYIYHNTIDTTGENAGSEEKTFEAVRTAIEELGQIVSFVVNSLNANHVVVTADHGFLYTDTAPRETERSRLDEKPIGTVKAKKRYLIGKNLPANDAVWRGRTLVTAHAEGDMEFWVPKSANRFHFAGGARFIHGGIMPQEVIIPVITVRHKKGKSERSVTTVKAVAVHVLGTNHKVTTNRHRFELIQVEPVGDRLKPITLKVAMYNGTSPITNIESVTFDSSSDRMDERKKWVQLVLSDQVYDKKTPYRLVLRDAETGVEHQSIGVIIDRAISDEF